MNRVAAPALFLQMTADLNKKNEEYAKAIVKKWGKDTGFLLTKDMIPVDPHLIESQTAEERLAWLKKRIDGFYNPATFLQKEGNSIGASDSGAAEMVHQRTVSTLSQLEHGLGEALLQIWLDINGFAGYSVEVRYPRPQTKNDAEILNEIAEANKNGQISDTEARQRYPNLDLPDETPEEQAARDAQYAKRKPAPSINPFGGFGQQQEIPIGNLSGTMPVSQVEAELLAATRQCAADVKRIVAKEIQNRQAPRE
jgi:hypothetical protein